MKIKVMFLFVLSGLFCTMLPMDDPFETETGTARSKLVRLEPSIFWPSRFKISEHRLRTAGDRVIWEGNPSYYIDRPATVVELPSITTCPWRISLYSGNRYLGSALITPDEVAKLVSIRHDKDKWGYRNELIFQFTDRTEIVKELINMR